MNTGAASYLFNSEHPIIPFNPPAGQTPSTPMSTHSHPLNRRLWLQSAGLCALQSTTSAWAQPDKSQRNLTVAQLVDFSPAQQDVSRDFLVGSQAAWQDINTRGGIRGRSVQHLTMETDGSPESLRAALSTAQKNPDCVVLSGTVGDHLATQVTRLSAQGSIGLAHVAPWLQNSTVAADDWTFPIFAARQDQVAYALKNLSIMGLNELGAVYANKSYYEAHHTELERIAAAQQLRMSAFQSEGDLVGLGKKMTATTPAILLFMGGTPELAQFCQGLERQSRQRYVLALADVNLNTLLQLNPIRNTAVIATQTVPLTHSNAPIVRNYRDTLAKLFDEAPTPLSLAGYIAARYTYEVLNDIDGAITRQTALAAFQRRSNRDLGGFRVTFNAQRRSVPFVTQSMMAIGGRIVS